MTNDEHLHISSITAFREGLLSQAEHTMAARHLIRCRDCRDLLPLPTKEEFLNALFGDHPQEQEIRAWVSIKGFLMEAIHGRPAIRNAVFASLLLFAVLGFSFLMWTQPGSSVDDSLVAVVTGNRQSNELHNLPSPIPEHSVTPAGKTTEPGNSSDKGAEHTPAPLPGRKVSRNEGGRQSLRSVSPLRAETRGSSLPCGGQRLIDFEARKTEDGLRLTWGKVPNAVSYSVYLSDLDERLIDQFETADKTTYLVTIPLDTETVYRWKLIATVKNGERIVSESQNFRIGGSRPIPVRRRTAAAVRCVEGKQ